MQGFKQKHTDCLMRFFDRLNGHRKAYTGEFGHECLLRLPYLHYLSAQTKQLKPVVLEGMEPFYFFLDEVVTVQKQRRSKQNYRFNGCTPSILQHESKPLRWLPPDFKKRFTSSAIRFEKPTLVISNKYSTEWGHEPVNFLDLDMLKTLFKHYQSSHQIVYARYTTEDDDSAIPPFSDLKMIESDFRGVYTLHGLCENYGLSWNETMLKVYAACEKFISVQGGGSVIASYFGGMNCIYMRKGLELINRDPDHLYPKLSGCKVDYIKPEKEWLKTDSSRYKIPYIDRDIKDLFLNLVFKRFSLIG